MTKRAHSRLSVITSSFSCPEVCTHLLPVEAEEHFVLFSWVWNVKDGLVNTHKLMGAEGNANRSRDSAHLWVSAPGEAWKCRWPDMARSYEHFLTCPMAGTMPYSCVSVPDPPVKNPHPTICCYMWAVRKKFPNHDIFENFRIPNHMCVLFAALQSL